MATIHDIEVLDFPSFGSADDRLTVVEGGRHVPFDIARTYTITGVEKGVTRGSHGHRSLTQVIVCLAGEVAMDVDDAKEKTSLRLSAPNRGLYVPPGLWTDTTYLSDGVVLLVLCDAPYDEGEYIRHYQDFLAFKKAE